MKKTRLRFAPSPTGYLHLGGLRTVLFAYIISQSLKGDLILRIEDTDRTREVEGAVDKLIDILNWAGIKFSEGPVQGGKLGPYIQSQRQEIYHREIRKLLDSQQAYYCFCSAERLAKMREEQQANKQAPKYDRHCRNLSAEEVKTKLDQGLPYVIRQKMPESGEVVARDELRGEIKFRAEDLDDHVLIKSDGFPTYQFASVVDDHLMEISHVSRGEEWIPSFPKNVLLYQAFGWEIPKFIHLPLILNKEGGKLSKRQNDVAVEDYKEQGYLPEAMLNFCALLGWHPKGDQEIMPLAEIIKLFKIKDMQISPAVFDRDKLDFFNGYYLRQLSAKDFYKVAKSFLPDELSYSDDYLQQAVLLEQTRVKKLSEIAEAIDFMLVETISYGKDLLLWKQLDYTVTKEKLELVKEELSKFSDQEWQKDILEEKIITFIKDQEEKLGDYLWSFRVALTGKKNSPGPFEVAAVLGREETFKRIDQALAKLT